MAEWLIGLRGLASGPRRDDGPSTFDPRAGHMSRSAAPPLLSPRRDFVPAQLRTRRRKKNNEQA